MFFLDRVKRIIKIAFLRILAIFYNIGDTRPKFRVKEDWKDFRCSFQFILIVQFLNKVSALSYKKSFFPAPQRAFIYYELVCKLIIVSYDAQFNYFSYFCCLFSGPNMRQLRCQAAFILRKSILQGQVRS